MTHHPLRRAAAALLGPLLLAACLAAAPAAAAPSAVTAAVPDAPGPVRVMALGDSITGSPGCWRALLYRDLVAAGHDVDMVGTLPTQGCGFAHDGDNEGHGGALVTDVAASGQAAAWFAATRPQVVLMHFATNDVWSNRSPGQILDAWTTLVGQLRAVDPDVVVVVAQIVPVAPPSCGECPSRTQALNEEVPAWATATSTAASPVLVVDHATGWVPARDTSDGVHPNDAGTARMAATWLPVVETALALVDGGGPSPTPTPAATPTLTPTPTVEPTLPPTPRPTPTPTVTMVPDAVGCTAAVTVASAWPGGFVATVRVTNTSPFFALDRWTVRIGLPDGEVVHAWSATATGAAPVTFTPAGWNSRVGSGGSVEFGFQGSGEPTPGAVTCVPS